MIFRNFLMVPGVPQARKSRPFRRSRTRPQTGYLATAHFALVLEVLTEARLPLCGFEISTRNLCQLTNHELTLNLTQSDGLQNPSRRSFFCGCAMTLSHRFSSATFCQLNLLQLKLIWAPQKGLKNPGKRMQNKLGRLMMNDAW